MRTCGVVKGGAMRLQLAVVTIAKQIGSINKAKCRQPLQRLH